MRPVSFGLATWAVSSKMSVPWCAVYKFMYDNKEQLDSSIVYDRDMSYEFFAFKVRPGCHGCLLSLATTDQRRVWP